MKKSRFSDSQIISILKQAKAGTVVPKLCSEHSISSMTFYRWRRKFRDKDSTVAAPMPPEKNDNQQSKPTGVKTKTKAESPQEGAMIARC